MRRVKSDTDGHTRRQDVYVLKESCRVSEAKLTVEALPITTGTSVSVVAKLENEAEKDDSNLSERDVFAGV